MFGDMFGDINAKQEALKEKLSLIKVKAESGDGAIIILANAAGDIENVKVDVAKMDTSDSDQLEDLILIAFNRIQSMIKTTEAAESQKLIKDILPPGMDNLFG